MFVLGWLPQKQALRQEFEFEAVYGSTSTGTEKRDRGRMKAVKGSIQQSFCGGSSVEYASELPMGEKSRVFIF